MAKWTKVEIEEQRSTIQRMGEFRVHIKYGRGGANGNVCTARLWHPDGKIVGRATGGGYDMMGSALGDAIELFFQPELLSDAAIPGGMGTHIATTRSHPHVSVDGACGIETMLSLLTALGFKARRFETGKLSCMILAEKAVES